MHVGGRTSKRQLVKQDSLHILFALGVSIDPDVLPLQVVKLISTSNSKIKKVVEGKAFFSTIRVMNLVVDVNKNNLLHFLCDDYNLQSKKKRGFKM